jgi:hypothetical protein
MLIGAVALVAVVQVPVDFTLGWKKGDAIAYTAGFRFSGENSGPMTITVTDATDAGFTVSWPEIKFSGGARSHPAGTAKLSRHGWIDPKSPLSPGTGFIVPMALPDKPIKVGDSYKLSIPGGAGANSIELSGKFEKVTTEKGRLAHLKSAGTMRNPDGSVLDVEVATLFDLDRRIVVEGSLSITKFNQVFFIKLAGQG